MIGKLGHMLIHLKACTMVENKVTLVCNEQTMSGMATVLPLPDVPSCHTRNR